VSESRLRIDVSGDRSVQAIRTPAEGRRAGWTFVYAPGAGSNMHDPFGRYLCRALADRGVGCVRFQFPYMEEGKNRPDRTAVLEATWRAVLERVRDAKTKLCVGGRSMGGRIGSHVVAQGEAADAVALFSYPLHPPGKPERRRDEHLPAIGVPVLFCSGTRDAFASPDELQALVKQLKRPTLHLLDGSDHGMNVPKSSGRTREDVWREAFEAMLGWLGI